MDEYNGWLAAGLGAGEAVDEDTKRIVVDAEAEMFKVISMLCLKHGATFTVGDGNQIDIDCPGPKEKEVKLAMEIRDELLRLGIIDE